MIPQMTGSIEANVNPIHMNISQTKELTVYNKVKSQSIVYNTNTHSESIRP